MAEEATRFYWCHLFRWSNYQRRPGLAETKALRNGSSRRLLVFVHGWIASRSARRVMQELLEDPPDPALRDCDLLAPLYPSTTFANANPYYLAAEIQRLIEEAWDERVGRADGKSYETVYLVGVSAGAVLVRKILLFARGQRDDHPVPERPLRSDWLAKIARVVLVAGMNRGWSLENKPEHMGWLRHRYYRLVLRLGRLPFWGRFIMSFERGAPFVADLRVQWLRERDSKTPLPDVVQLLGEVDDIVTREDSKDIAVAGDFHFVPVPGTGHGNMLDFSEPNFGSHRRTALVKALTTTLPLASMRQGTATDVVFLMHGIRTNSDWTNRLKTRIEALAPEFVGEPASYGYFPMLPFLLFSARQRNVRWFMDRYTEALATYPGARFHFAGHSNGTYLLSAGLARYRSLRMDRVYLAGSVIPSAYPWRSLRTAGRIGPIRNDRAAGDWVVGIFPGFYEWLGKGIRIRWLRDIGTGGLRGFDDPPLTEYHDMAYFKGGHSAAIEDHRLDGIAAYLIAGTTDRPNDLGDRQRRLTSLLSRLCWVVWIVLLLIVGGLGWLILMVGGGWYAAAYAAAVIALLLSV
jgi:alpha-beta hydrolase superfamily lysophospholipase